MPWVKRVINLRPFYTVIRISGNDAETFLQGQLTCDMTQITTQKGTLAAHCNRQGRMISLFYIIRSSIEPIEFVLILPASIAALTIESLKRYVFRSKVNFKLDDAMSIAGMMDRDPPVKPEDDVLSVGADPCFRPSSYQTKISANTIDLSIPGNRTVRLSTNHLNPSPEEDVRKWQHIDIEAQTPWLCPETSEIFIPNEIHLEQHHGLSFTKGCYIGQEIIARLHYLGKSKKQLYRIILPMGTQIKSGGTITLNDSPIGELICGIENMHKSYTEGLAILNSQVLSNQLELGAIDLR